jgi:hypothetical protein
VRARAVRACVRVRVRVRGYHGSRA